MSGVHPGWLRRDPEPAQVQDYQPTRQIQRCLVCKSEFMQTYHIRHQVLCGNPRCKRIRHRAANRRYEKRRAAQIPNDRPVSRHTGVHWRDRPKPWVAQIKVSGNQVYLGSFATEEEAAEAYQAAARDRST